MQPKSPLYLSCQNKTVRDETGLKIKGPVFFKTDTGPGWLCNDEEHLKCHEEMLDSGLYMLLGLQNGTKNIKEMDQAYSEIKPATDKCTVPIAAMKMAKWVKA